MIVLQGFDWDGGNWPKCAKHGLSKEEIEGLFERSPFVMPDPSSRSEDRFNAVGTTKKGRHVFVVFTFRGDLIRPISARYMHQKEVLHYERKS